MKNVIITGSSGMVGGLVLNECLQRDDVGLVTTIVRKESEISHPKLKEIIHQDFMNFDGISEHLSDQDACFFCLGIYTGAASKEVFRNVTVDYANVFAGALKKNSGQTTFCYLSGQGADSTETSRIMFARDKGTAENLILKLGFDQTYLFRPSYIYPVTPREEPNFSYRLFRFLYKPLLSKLGTGFSITSEKLAQAMVDIGLNGGTQTIYENRDICSHPS